MHGTMLDLAELAELKDEFGRRFTYLRLSITDACGYRCAYCLPQGYQKTSDDPSLTLHEIQNLVVAMSALGTWKIRLTGGEPTLRRDLISIIETVANVPGIRKVALSTNGDRLKNLASDLKKAGLTALNVSVDSLDPIRFKEATGMDRLKQVLEGIEKALDLGYTSVKINAVLLKDMSSLEWNSWMEWLKRHPITVRFIELMPTGQNREFFQKNHLSSQKAYLQFLEWGWRPQQRHEADGPAVEFLHPDYLGRFGLIAPYSNDFCSTCNRLRVTSHGKLKLCLFGGEDHSIRHFLKEPSQKEELIQLIRSLTQRKKKTHELSQGKIGNNSTFSAMGG